MMINDAIYLLDEALKKLPEIRETENKIANQSEWAQLSADEQNEKMQ